SSDLLGQIGWDEPARSNAPCNTARPGSFQDNMPGLSRSSRGVPHLTRGLLLVGLLHAAGSAAAAQLAPVRTTAAENFRREPQGQVLARIDAGTRLAILGTSGSWTEAVLEGWIWTASLQVTERGGFDLVVSA